MVCHNAANVCVRIVDSVDFEAQHIFIGLMPSLLLFWIKMRTGASSEWSQARRKESLAKRGSAEEKGVNYKLRSKSRQTRRKGTKRAAQTLHHKQCDIR